MTDSVQLDNNPKTDLGVDTASPSEHSSVSKPTHRPSLLGNVKRNRHYFQVTQCIVKHICFSYVSNPHNNIVSHTCICLYISHSYTLYIRFVIGIFVSRTYVMLLFVYINTPSSNCPMINSLVPNKYVLITQWTLWTRVNQTSCVRSPILTLSIKIF